MKRTLPAFGLLLATAQPALANIDIQFDFSYDTLGFFSDPIRIDALNAAAAVFETRFTDTLTAIDSSGTNSFDAVFFNPADPFGDDVVLADQSVAADVIRVYVGGAHLGGNALGLGGPGGYGCGGLAAFCGNVENRGQGTVYGPAATDFATWGGMISFNSTTAWHFGLAMAGLDTHEYDFYTVAVHELAHVLGFGTADSFGNLVHGANFVGASAGTVALHADGSHWAQGVGGWVGDSFQEASMTATIANGQRKHFTDLDFAAMQDIGWQVTAVPEIETWAMLLAGVGLVGFATCRRLT